MTVFGKHLYCQKGDMEFSEHLTNRFNECFVEKSSLPKDFQFSFTVGGSWFCPADGDKMLEIDGYIKCPKCSLSLNEFIHSLVERHVHK